MASTFSPDKPVQIYYFSGTGNTQLVAARIADALREKGHEVSLMRMEEASRISPDPEGVLGIGFPVAVFSTYPLVWRFIHSLPDSEGTPVFAFDTMGGTSLGGVMGRLRLILSRKGYVPAGAGEFRMPLNIFFKVSEKYIKTVTRNSLLKAGEFARNMLDGKARWPRIPVVSDLMYLSGRMLFKLTELKLHQKLLKIRTDPGKCTRCGNCVKRCPLHNIRLGESVVIGDGCQYCLRCVAVCPRAALSAILSPRSLHYKAQGAVF
jgi:flavodoxin/NAD-dependent dihydropyrimidine dehydrogenase PreA subunit